MIPSLEVADARYLHPGNAKEARRQLRAAGDAAIAKRRQALLGDDNSPGREIRDAFKRRDDRVYAFRFRWKQRTVDDRGTPDPNDDIVCPQEHSWAVHGRLSSHTSSGIEVVHEESDNYLEAALSDNSRSFNTQSRFDGETLRYLNAFTGRSKIPGGSSQPSGRHRDPLFLWDLPVFWTYETFDPITGGFDWRKMEVLEQLEDVDRRPCIVIRNRRKADRGINVSWWVDPARDYAIIRHFQGHIGQPAGIDMRISHIKDKQWGWVPSSWRITQSSIVTTVEVTDYEINPDIPHKEFVLAFPPGTKMSN